MSRGLRMLCVRNGRVASDDAQKENGVHEPTTHAVIWEVLTSARFFVSLLLVAIALLALAWAAWRDSPPGAMQWRDEEELPPGFELPVQRQETLAARAVPDIWHDAAPVDPDPTHSRGARVLSLPSREALVRRHNRRASGRRVAPWFLDEGRPPS